MKGRLPTVLASTAVLIAVAGFTPLGQAASDAIPRFARNADKVDGIHASRTPKAGRLLALNKSKKFPASVLTATGTKRARDRYRRERHGLLQPEIGHAQLPGRKEGHRRRRACHRSQAPERLA